MADNTTTQPTLFSEEALATLSRAVHGWEEGPWRRRSSASPSAARTSPRAPRRSNASTRRSTSASFDYARDLGFPGEYPFTRGVQPTMYRGRFWTMRQYAGFGTAEESNQKFRYLLSQGQTGLSVAFDLPSQLGYDSDDPMAIAEVGQVGVAIDSLYDMETLFNGHPSRQGLDEHDDQRPRGGDARDVHRRRRKAGRAAPTSSTAPSRTTCSRSTSPAARTSSRPGRASAVAADIMAYCAKQVPQWNTISVSGYHIREAGSTAAQEIGFSFANACAYMDAALEQGVGIDEVAPRISWIFNTHNNFFEEIAKYRALRRLWARLLKEQLRREGSALDDAPHAHADRRQHARRAAAREQHRPRRHPVAGGGRSAASRASP